MSGWREKRDRERERKREKEIKTWKIWPAMRGVIADGGGDCQSVVALVPL